MRKSNKEMTGVYSPFLADNLDPHLITQKLEKRETALQMLPWPLEALPGTMWCNVHTGSRSLIAKVDTDRWGKPVPFAERDEDFSAIGGWQDDRFCIKDWVRIDHLPASGQLAWFCHEIDYLQKQIKRQTTPEEIAPIEGFQETPLSSFSFSFTCLRWHTYTSFYAYFRKMVENLAIAINLARKFTLQHDIPMPTKLLNTRNFSRKNSVNSSEEEARVGNVHFSLSEIYQYTFNQMSSLLSEADEEIQLEVPCYSIGHTKFQHDIAHDYLKALFVGETLAANCKYITLKEHWDDITRLHSVFFSFRPQNVPEVTRVLLNLSHGFINSHEYLKSEVEFYGLPEGWLPEGFFNETPKFNKFQKEMTDFETKLEKRVLRFPELADAYLANYIHGLSAEGIEQMNNIYPEWKYRFWRSFTSKRIGFDFYVSSSSWILPLEVDIENLLVEYGGFRQEVPGLHEAIPLTMGNLTPIIFNKNYVAGYPSEEIARAQKCAEEVFSNRLNMDFEGRPLNIINCVFLDDEGDLLVVSDQIAQYIFFRECLPRVSPNVLQIILDNLTVLAPLTGEEPSNISCSWSELDDNQFEELCYDVILYRYHPASIRKMGKSRSRDGGRDIVFEMSGRLGKPAIKWIAQCKLISDGGSLTSKKVEVSDTVDQYGASGFCVMTSGVIDSTLYDKLDGISRNRSIQADTWSKLELERFLVRHPVIHQRYFKNQA